MTTLVKHALNLAIPDGTDLTLVKPTNWNAGHVLTLADGFVIGREEGTDGNAQELPIQVTPGGDVSLSASLGFFRGARGTTAQRPVAPALAMERWNISLSQKEIYTGASWDSYALTSNLSVLLPTGTMIDTLRAAAPTGYIFAFGTIGDASSGATNRANVDTLPLFTLLWNDWPDLEAPVSGGRGVSAAADWAAHKTITVSDLRGRLRAGIDNMGGSSANRLGTGATGGFSGTAIIGKTGGQQSHVQTLAEIATHNHTFHGDTGLTPGGSGLGLYGSGANPTDNAGTIGSNGSGTAFNVVQPTMSLNVMISLGVVSDLSELTARWMDAIFAKGGAISLTQRNLINTLFIDLTDALETGTVLSRFVDIRVDDVDSLVAAYTTLVRLVTPVPHGSSNPTFITWRGISYDGVSQYDDWGIKLSDYTSIASADDMFAAARAQTNTPTSNVAFGARNDAVQLVAIYPRSGSNQLIGYMSGTNISGPAVLNEKQQIGFQRFSGAYLAALADVFISVSAPGTPGASVPNINLFCGANNINGVASEFRFGIHAHEFVMSHVTPGELASINAAFEKYHASAALLADPDNFVSSVSLGGIPIGSDTNPGTMALPFLTARPAFLYAPANANVQFNGSTISPPLYTSSSPISISDPMVVSAINALGARLAGNGTGQVASVSLTSGGTLTFEDIIIDPSQNTSGPGTYAFNVDAQAIKFGLTFNRALLRSHGTIGYAIYAPLASTRLDLTLVDTDIFGGAVRGNIDIRNIIEGSINIDGGTSTITNAKGAGGGALTAIAKDIDVTAVITNHDMTVTLDATFSGATAVGYNLYNIPTLIDGGSYSISSPFSGTLPIGYPVAISQGRITDLIALPIHNSKITNLVISNTCWGGAQVRMGDDNALRSLANDCEISHLSVSGNANFAAGGGHSLWPCNLTRPHVYDCEANIGGIGLVDKSNLDGIFEDFTIRRHTSSYILNKASINSIYRDFFVYAYAGYAGNGVLYSVGDNIDVGVSGTGTFTNGRFENLGAVGWVIINVPPGFGFAMTGCHFELTSGTLAATPFVTPLGNFSTFAAFNAVYPGNTANFA